MARFGSRSTTGWKATVSVAMSNYIEAGSIIAIATSLGFWQASFGIGNFAVGLLAAISANAFGRPWVRSSVVPCAIGSDASSSTPTTCCSTCSASCSRCSPKTW